MLKWLTKRNTK